MINLLDTRSFNCLNRISIFHHYTNTKSKLTQEENGERSESFAKSIKEFSEKTGEVIAIPEEDAILVNEKEL